jgi:RNA polymerase sigma-70 factor (ECF subfamily)
VTAERPFDDFYRESRDRVALHVTAVCGDPIEALDFAQEAFARAWSRWDRIGGYEDPEGWVRRVAFNLAVGRWRRARRILLTPRLPVPSVELPDETSAVIAALQELPLAQRRAIVLHHLVGLSVDDVARELSAPTGTVKSWLSRGRLRLADRLAADIPSKEFSND